MMSGHSPKDLLMRYAPAAAALSLVVLISASTGRSAEPPLDPHAAALAAAGAAALSAGNSAQATDDFEAALVLAPGNSALVLDLAQAARMDGMQGKALHYYRMVLTRDPQNLDALAGEGGALAEKGATEKARARLAQLQGLCGSDCAQSRGLAEAIQRAAQPQVVTAEALKPTAKVSAN